MPAKGKSPLDARCGSCKMDAAWNDFLPKADNVLGMLDAETQAGLDRFHVRGPDQTALGRQASMDELAEAYDVAVTVLDGLQAARAQFDKEAAVAGRLHCQPNYTDFSSEDAPRCPRLEELGAAGLRLADRVEASLNPVSRPNTLK